jgi:hypothetical protein
MLQGLLEKCSPSADTPDVDSVVSLKTVHALTATMKVCIYVHSHLTDRTDPADIDCMLQLLHAAGGSLDCIAWWRVDLPAL